jgi:DNA-binding transcriptional LysR family regulator
LNRQTLEYFIALSETLNFTEAARRQFVSQTTISRAIKQLEKEIGFALFERCTTKVQLTAAGSDYLINVKSVLKLYDKAVEDGLRLSYKENNVLKVGFSNDLGFEYVTEVLKQYQQKNEKVEIVLQQGTPAQLLIQINDGTLDIISVFKAELQDEKGINSLNVCQYNVKVGVGPFHRFAGRETIAATELKNEKIILPKRESFQKHYDYILNCCRQDGFDPIVIEVDSFETQLLLTELGRGISFYPDSDGLTKKYQTITFLKINQTHHQYNIEFAWNQANKNPCLNTFLNTTRDKI